jgi:DNA replication protein DnaD
MAKKNKGYIPLWRDIQDNHIWTSDEPFDIRSAWIDLLLSVNHKEEKILIGRRLQVIKPGQMWTSYVKLGRKWHWSYKRVLRYINLLKSDGMLYADGTPNGTLLTIVNWGNFTIKGNAHGTTHDTTNDTPVDTSDATPDAIQTIIYKNIKNDKERKEKRSGDLEIEPPTGGGKWQ